jgi:mannose-6-phosphate isomerase-like protein (cupin superfamily)
MQVKHLHSIPTLDLPGLTHQTVASHTEGIHSFEVWHQSLGPGAGTPIHKHDCEEVIVFTAGVGVMRYAATETTCTAGTVLLCQPNELHQIVNTGNVDLRLYGILSISPVPVLDEQGDVILLPW